jgi:YidC/Oxa1 family membrane protein insertase
VLAGSPLDPLYNAIGYVLAFFYLPLGSLGIAIILLTLVVMAVQFPLIAKQTRSMIQMQRVQPEMKKIQQKYKDDRQKQNEELLKLYQEHKINPLAGCLPLIVTLPIGIAVFRTFNLGVQRHIPQSGPFNKLYNDICTKATIAYGRTWAAKDAVAHSKPVPNLTDAQACNDGINHYPAGKTPPVFRFLGMNLNWSAHEVQSQLSGHWIEWIPYFLLIALVIFTGWYQVRQTQARQAKQGSAQPNAQMQAITKIMPVFFGVITYGLNAATTMYFLVSNTWRIGQQHFVLNKMYEEEMNKPKPGAAPPPEDAPPEPAPPKAGGNGGRGGRPSGSKPAKPKAGGPAGKDGGATNGEGNRSMSGAARRKRKRKR